MAIASPLNLQQITTGVRSLGVAVTRAQVSANRSAGILVNRNKIKRKLVFGDRLSFDRRRERVRRRQEDIIESSSIGGFIKIVDWLLRIAQEDFWEELWTSWELFWLVGY